ncbi:MAG: hypothetical protein ONB46_14910 [candidate division KSB1 bacterium]|nr:hypothetical protein [candidate division KSB1 bacterium]MDZ7367019.1 hypothetical protein [candidate division KSB1 bacterium]MDZ7406719.1 hypothetical protein [candidate division KSB1 bacterium]
MTILSALRDGLRRMSASPKLILFLWLFNFAMALPLTIIMSGQIESSIGASLVHEKLRKGFDIDWYEDFAHDAEGLGKTFSPAVIGAGPFIGNLETWLNGSLFTGHPGIVGLGLGYMVVWMFLLGGILDRFAHGDGRLTAERFFSASGRYFLRFILLFLLGGVFYFFVFTFISPLLFSTIADLSRDATVERTIFFWTMGAYLIVALFLVVVNMVFDYAKIATVINGHRNMLVATFEGFRFVFSHPAKTFGLYLLLGMALAFLLGIYALPAPGAGQASSLAVILALLAGQIFLATKLIARLAFFGGQMALYETVKGIKSAPQPV